MYNPTKIIVKNIGSFKEFTYDFSNKVVLLTGENLTDEGQDSNGSGKSFFLESLCYSLTGGSFRKVTDSEIVREGESEGYILFTAYNEVLKKTLAIERTIYAGKKSSKLEIFINTEKQTKITSVNEGNKFILDELGLSREDILNYFLISKERFTSFFSSTDSAKKDLISRFSKAILIDSALPFIQSDKNLVTQQILALEKKVTQITTRLEILEEGEDPIKLKEAEEKNKIKKTEISKSIQTKKKENSKIFQTDIELEDSITQIKTKISNLKGIEDLKEKIKTKEFRIANISKETLVLRRERKDAESVLDTIERNLAGVVECPKCEHRFSLADPDFDEIESLEIKEGVELLVLEFVESIEKTGLEVPQLEIDIQLLNDEINKSSRIKSDMNISLNQTLGLLKQNKSTYDFNLRSISNLETELTQLNEKSFESSVDPSKKKELLNDLKAIEKQMGVLTDEERGFDLWDLNFKSFKNFLTNKSLKNITNQTNFYLEKLGSSIRIKFEGFKELKDGSTREKIDTRVFKFGEDRGSFGKLSGGEKARVEIAVILSLSSLINMSSHSGGLNLVVVDEILESLDTTGLKSILKAMNNIDQHVILVTHGKLDTKEGYNEVKIIKANGVSSLEIL